MARRYPTRDIKILFSKSAGYCAFPQCTNRCVEDATEHDRAAVLGQIAHIESHSDKGPRANPLLTSEQRDRYENWVLLCGHHHPLVDKQDNTYTAEDLRRWKTDLEQRVYNSLATEMQKVSFSELDTITKAILNNPTRPSSDFRPLQITEKLERNLLSDDISSYVTMGLVKFGEVEGFLEKYALIDYDYAERLKAGFVNEYNRQLAIGMSGDSLFSAMMDFSWQGSSNFREQAAGLAVLVYMFHKCEIFES